LFIPLHDANSLKSIRFQFVTFGLILANVLIYLLTNFSSEDFQIGAILGFGYIPSVAFDTVELPPGYDIIPEDLTYITYAFLHSDMWHLGGNMLFLWVFGDNVEDALGHVKFLIFYLLCAIAGALFHGLVAPASEAPLIGASGAIAGVVAAYLILHPRVKIWVLVFARIPLRLPAYIMLVLWIGFQFVMFATGGDEQISWSCHVGGIIAGAILVLLLKRRDVPIFDREIVSPRAVKVEQPSAVEPIKAQPAPRWGRQ
jgi:membrane associated rhomboid family serine protease